jgi:tetratricopeptide (TPR) repeat protein
MVCTMLMCCALLGADGSPSGIPSPAANLSAYLAAKNQVGRDPNAHVRLALWCESHGLQSERMKHLALAVLYDPSHALARGLLGMVSYQGKWGRPEVVGPQVQNDPAYRDAIREYLDRRPRTADKADAQLKLAAWCEQKGLKAQAQTHYEQVIQLDPTRDTAWKHLGFKKQGNRWVKSDQALAARQEAERQKQADKHWRPILEKLRDDLRSKDASRRARAEQQLTDVTDPRAVPMIWGLFIFGSESSQVAAIFMLNQIEGPAASNALAALAIFSPRAEVQRRASESLARRDLRDILTRLIALIGKPFKYQVRPVSGPGSTGVLFVEGEKFNVQRIYRSIPINPSLLPAGAQSFSAEVNNFNASGGRTMTPLMLENQLSMPAGAAVDPFDYLAAQVRNSAQSSRDVQNGINQLQQVRDANTTLQQSLAQDVQAIDAINERITQLNSRVLPIVEAASGQKLGAEPEKWKGWWTDQLGYAFQASQPAIKPTFTDIVDASSWSASLECFGQGTLVHAAGGARPIESIQIGDRVLSQNTSSGVLSYQPVMAVHRTKTAATIRVAVERETIVATGIHRFWKTGKGWTMARDLKAGDRLRMPGSVVEVRAVENDKNQTVYNLDIAENGDFFVGRQGVLVHDSNFVKPVSEPFDFEPEIAALTPGAKSGAR